MIVHRLFFRYRAGLVAALQCALLGLVLLTMCGSYSLSAGLADTSARTGTLASGDRITVGVWIANRDLAGEQKLLDALSRPGGSAYHRWLSSTDFQTRFGPTAAAISAVRRFLTAAHLRVLPASSSNLVLASGTVSQVEHAFRTAINVSGRYYSPSRTPSMPTALAPLVTGVFGLTNQPLAQANNIPTRKNKEPDAAGAAYGGGVGGSGLTPAQIAGIYHATPLYLQGNRGQGTTLALFEHSGYTDSDIRVYEDTYHLPHVPLFDMPVLGGPADHSAAAEVEMDIELQIAMAPGARRLLVYNAPNNGLGSIMEYDRIAQDNLADAISTSWSVCEYLRDNAFLQTENQIFLRMALQGQSIFASSGDAGAYDCAHQTLPLIPPTGQERQVTDPGGQPYITSVGGTSFQGVSSTPLFDPGSRQHPAYPGQQAEKPWSRICFVAFCGGASGGGISRTWAEPDYARDPLSGQYDAGIVGQYSRTGTYCQQQPGVLCREVPDVSLNADPYTGYSIYCTDPGDSSCAKTGWLGEGGTSASAPLWAGIAALAIRQQQNQRVGLLNYILYALAAPGGYAHQFHDIISPISNGLPFQNAFRQVIAGYTATRHYDLITGIGTPDIAQLVAGIALQPVPGKG